MCSFLLLYWDYSHYLSYFSLFPTVWNHNSSLLSFISAEFIVFFQFIHPVKEEECSWTYFKPWNCICFLKCIHDFPVIYIDTCADSPHVSLQLSCQVSAATAYATWSAVPMVESALQTVPMATSAYARSASGEHFVRRVSRLHFSFPHIHTYLHKKSTHLSRLQEEFCTTVKVGSKIPLWFLLTRWLS